MIISVLKWELLVIVIQWPRFAKISKREVDLDFLGRRLTSKNKKNTFYILYINKLESF